MSRGLLAAGTLAVALIALAPSAPAAYRWEQHLHGSNVVDLVATGDALWLGTTAGLVRMDLGDSTLTIFRRDERGMPSDSINALAVDAAGNVWCGTASAGVAIRRAQGGWDFVRTFDGLPGERVLALGSAGTTVVAGTSEGFAIFGEDDVSGCTIIDPCVDEMPSMIVQAVMPLPGEVWFGTASGVARQQGTSLAAASDGLPNTSVLAFETYEGDVWCGTTAGVFRFDDASDTWSLVEGVTVTVTTTVTDLLATDEGLFAASPVGGPRRVYRWNGTDWSVVGVNFAVRHEPQALAMDPSGRIWAGTGNGVQAWDPTAGVWTPPIRVPGLADSRALWTVETGEGEEVWVGHRARVPAAELYDGTSWMPITPETSGGAFEDRDVQAIFVDHRGRTWFGHCCCTGPGCFTDRLTRDGDDTWARIPAVNTRAIASDGGSLFFFGSGAEDPAVVGEGLAIWHESFPEDSVFVIRDDHPDYPLSSNTITALAVDPAGRVWIGHRTHGVDVWSYGLSPFDPSDDTWVHLEQTPPVNQEELTIISDAVLALAADGPRVWIGTANGVTLFENLRSLGSWGQSTLGNAFVTSVAVTSDGSAWAGRPAAGVVRFVPNALGTYDREFYDFPELTTNAVNAVATKGRTVWVATNRGVAVGRPVAEPDAPGPERAGSAYPNPYHPRQHAGVRLVDVDVPVDGAVYDAAGGLVASFRDVQPGEVVWDGRIETDGVRGVLAAPGLYAIVARAENLRIVARVALVR